MAWVERLSSGKWRGGWRDPAGRKRYTRRPEFPEHPYGRKRDALEAAQEAEVKARRRAATRSGAVSAKITWGEWWETAAPTGGDTETAVIAQGMAKRFLIPKWGDTPLNEITQKDVKAWVADLAPGKEPSYTQRIFGEFRRSMNLALDGEVLTASPCVGIKLPKIPRKQKAYVDEEHLASIRPHLHPYIRDITDVGLDSGLRPNELCGLHADSVDLDTGWLTVADVSVGRLIRSYPKDKDARRVPLTVQAVDIIRRRLTGRDLTAGCGVPHADGRPCRSVLVFVNSRRGPVTVEAWRIAMQRAAGKAKVQPRTPYAVRRGFATRAARGGLDAFELADLMGHADVKQTRAYVQQTPDARDRLRAALGDAPRLTVVGRVGRAG